ncbi:MAG TPA: hypothetical protein VLJ80_03925 [Solirubrobacteraceae bacterium]|nr:hypothetical protein [Solirubrobacteraceae bacterium]
MKRVKWLMTTIAVISLAALASAASASARTPLILEEGSIIASAGSPASGSLELTCAHIVFAGTLTIANEPTDKAVFTEGGGTDLCEGVVVRGVVKAIKVSGTDHFVVTTHLTYEVLTSGKCVYVIGKLAGAFTIPGFTTSTVSGTGKLATKRSTPGCAEQIAIGEAHAVLSSGTTHEPYFAEK